MMNYWDEFLMERATRSPAAVRVSLTNAGILNLNRRALDLLGDPDWVVLYFDRVNSVIGVRPGTEALPHALRLAMASDSQSKFVRAKRFCSFHRIGVERAVRFTAAHLNAEGYLVLDLKQARRSIDRFDGRYADR